MITIATAECFTHGILAREIHALAQDYEDDFGCKYSNLVSEVQKDCLKDAILEDKCSIFDLRDLSVTCGLFIPTLDAVRSILQIDNPVEPLELIKGIKVYDDVGDIEMSILMAEAAKKIEKTLRVLIYYLNDNFDRISNLNNVNIIYK